eukprot:TRINITY_DN32901_c1_g1_i1.p1 TRINITY_DN32901_c1_g1~~TRINITY_DN32901_c1_g1_i1.p1  ORF type:complete len:532 (-),score=45.33 TRINITY_DN32901_c1_g1_i1:485-2080(-)
MASRSQEGFSDPSLEQDLDSETADKEVKSIHKRQKVISDEEETENQQTPGQKRPELQLQEDQVTQEENCVEEQKSDVSFSSPSRSKYLSAAHKPQGPIRSGSTNPSISESRYLVFNLAGKIVCHANDGHKVIAASFHNVQRKKIPLITDSYGFEIGALSSEGLVLASRGEGEKAPVLMVKVFDSWASNTDWMFTLSDEEKEQPFCVTIGSCFVAVALRNRTLHLFDLCGSIISVIGMIGDVVALSAFEDQIAVAMHAGAPANVRDQNLIVEVFSVQQQSKQCEVRLPLSPESKLKWMDFSQEGQLCTMDSEGVVWRLHRQFGYKWCPIFDSELEREDQEIFWPVGVKLQKFACVICNLEEPYPKVAPSPFLSMRPLRVPVLSQPADLESENMLLLQDIQSCGISLEDLDKLKTDKAKKICSLFWANVKAEKFHRAYNVALKMDQIKELQVALNMAKKSGRTSLIQRLEQLLKNLQERDENMSQDGDELGSAGFRTPLSLHNMTTPQPTSRTGSKRKLEKIENPFLRSVNKT